MRDREIVAAIVAGDPAGLAAAYDRYAAALHGYCQSLLAEPADSADAVQDTFVIAAAKLGDLRDPDRLRPWLYAVARNECHRRLRGRARIASLEEAGEVTDPAQTEPRAADQAALKELVTSAVAGLNPGDREVIELSLRHDLNGADLADALGVPVNQAHALASRARAQLERSLGALLVARSGRKSCAELDAILAGWDGDLTILLRKRISRHVESCETCGERKRRELSPAMLFSMLPLVALPRGLRQQVLRLVSDSSPHAASYRDLVVRRAGRFGPSGFPVQVSSAGRSHRRGLRSRALTFAAAAALIVAVGGGTTAYLLSHHRHVRPVVGATVTLTITARPSQAGIPVVQTPVPSVGGAATTSATAPAVPTAPAAPSRSATAPSTGPSPTVSPGTLSASQAFVRLQQSPLGGPYIGTFTLTAQGGPVTYSILVPASEQAYLSLSPLTGTLQAGTSQVITATLTPNPNGPRPAYSNPLTVEPGGINVTVDYPPSG
ncbi:MAG TPA: sigma-70 family RNA polymerase sigma factor [Streptosporangiaceae bacterium]|nr:sigma-70 family RNA polymerase sigma factor [Streptosporangiaceae bacterium]